MARAKQQEIPGTERVGFKDIDKLADKFIDVRDQKAELASELTKIEGQIIEKMIEHQLSEYFFADQKVVIKPGKEHIKVKTVKSEEEEEEAAE